MNCLPVFLSAICRVEQVQPRLEPLDLVLLRRPLVHHVVEVARLQQLDLLRRHLLLLVLLLVLLAALQPRVDHVEVELVGVLVEGLLLQPLDRLLLLVEVPGALPVVFLLLQQPQVLPGGELGGNSIEKY